MSIVTHERTKRRPTRSYPQHAAGYVTYVLVGRVLGKPTYGSGSLPEVWLRDRGTELHERVIELLDAARDRALFDSDEVLGAYEAYMGGTNNASMLGKSRQPNSGTAGTSTDCPSPGGHIAVGGVAGTQI